MSQTRWDGLCACFSAVFVFFWFIIHMRSLVLACYAILIILLSFHVTQLLYIEVFSIKYYSTLHLILTFIILGRAADNFFVMFDAWEQSGQIMVFEGNFRKRMAYAWRRACKTLLTTTITTTLAFLSTSITNMIPIRSFGLYAAILIPINFFFVIFMFPPMLVVYDKLLAHRLLCFTLKKNERKNYFTQNDTN